MASGVNIMIVIVNEMIRKLVMDRWGLTKAQTGTWDCGAFVS